MTIRISAEVGAVIKLSSEATISPAAVPSMALCTPSAPRTMPSSMPMQALLVSMFLTMNWGVIFSLPAALSAVKKTV